MEAYLLVEKLKDFMDQHGEEAQVRIASQPAWPFEYDIKGFVDSIQLGPEEACEDEEEFELERALHEDKGSVFYIVEGEQLGYFRKEAWEVCS